MSIFSTIKKAAGSLFSGILGNSVSQAAGVYGAISGASQPPKSTWMSDPKYINPGSGGYNPQAPQQTGYGSGGQKYYNNYQPSIGFYSPVSTGTVQYGPNRSGSAGTYTPQPQPTVSPFRFDKQSGQTYLRTANVGNMDISGKTQEEADQAIGAMKQAQQSQVTANTSAVFNPDSISNTNKKVKDFKLSLDKITNNAWVSQESKQDQVQTLLKSTAKDIATDYNTPEEIANAYASNPDLQQNLDQYAQAGGSDQMLVDAINEKNKAKQDIGDMTTGDYLGAVTGNKEQTGVVDNTSMTGLVQGNKLITDEIARTANIPKELKDLYFGDEGLMAKRISIAEETRDLIKEKLSDEKRSLREKANLQIEKNNADLTVAESTIEQNRINAKNYMTGMLAKLGALQTTSAAAEGLTILDQRYQKQSADAKSKVRQANQEIELKLRDAIDGVENNANENIIKINEDLSKDQETIMKEVMKEQNAADKRVFDLTLKMNKETKKNIDKYVSEQTTLAEQWANDFSNLISGGLDVSKAAGQVNVKLGTADKRLSESARIKDPRAISYFKTLPTEVQKDWINYTSQLDPSTFFTLEDLQMTYPKSVIDQLTAKTTTTKSKGTTSIEDVTI